MSLLLFFLKEKICFTANIRKLITIIITLAITARFRRFCVKVLNIQHFTFKVLPRCYGMNYCQLTLFIIELIDLHIDCHLVMYSFVFNVNINVKVSK